LQDDAPDDALLDAVIALYDHYDEIAGVPDDVLRATGLPLAFRNAMHDAYDLTQKGRRMSLIRTALLDGVERCPVCGISAPRELDHYLPRSLFKCLAIYVRNLVPYCHDCNNSKKTHAGGDDKRFIHPYFDEIPDVQFLQATVLLQGGALRVEFAIVGVHGLDEDLRARLDHQLERLKLNERFQRELNNYMSAHTAAMHIVYGAALASGVSQFLATQAQVEHERLHRNDWRAVLLRALSEHHAFCDGGFREVYPLPANGGGPLLSATKTL
jgi:hypothetical protein